MTISVDLLASDDPKVAELWHTLEIHNTSYFLAWGWIETWLAALPAEHRPQLAVISDGGAPIAAGFLGRHWSLRHHLLPSRALFLNATGIERYDELCLEHNGLVGAAAIPALVEGLPRGWDELWLPAIDPTALPTDRFRVVIDREVAAPFVDLAEVRASRDGYLGLLGTGTRAQIRRARRGIGPLAIEIAEDEIRARAIFDELVALHTATWHRRGEGGAFADPWILQFHRTLIAKRFAAGELELMRVTAGDVTVGCLYNLVYRGRVLFYQSGLAHYPDPRIKPGLVCHAAAISHAAASGRAVYDFLAGDSRYKRSLATRETKLAWVRIQRPLARFAVEERLRGWKQSRWLGAAPLL